LADIAKNIIVIVELGICTYSFPWSIDTDSDAITKLSAAKDLLFFAAKNKIQHVQFGDNLPLHCLSANEIISLKKYAEDLHINLQVGTKRLDTGNVMQYIDIACQLHSPFLRIVIDDSDYRPGEEEIISIIQSLLPHLRRNDVVLAIENHDRVPVSALERIICKTDPQIVGICLDTVNSIGAGEGIAQVVKVLGPYAVNLHVKDFKIQRSDHKMGFTVAGTAAGEGMLDIPWLIGELNKYGRCKTATLEIWSNREDTMEKTIIKERLWVEKSIHYLKTILA
jgi:3-oxoisoapionate decarboxylase